MMYGDPNMIIQFWCSGDQTAKKRTDPSDWGFKPLFRKRWYSHYQTCETDADCPRPDLGQACMTFHWEGTTDGDNFSNGYSCFNNDFKSRACNGSSYAIWNGNYEQQDFNYYLEFTCTDADNYTHPEEDEEYRASAAETLTDKGMIWFVAIVMSLCLCA